MSRGMRAVIFCLGVEGDEGMTYQKITVPRETRLELRLAIGHNN